MNTQNINKLPSGRPSVAPSEAKRLSQCLRPSLFRLGSAAVLITFYFFCISLLACSSSSNSRTAIKEAPEQTSRGASESQLFSEINEKIDEQSFFSAINSISDFKQEYPLSTKMAEVSFLEGIALFNLDRFKEAIATFSDFQQAYPAHPQVPRAMLMTSRSHFERYQDQYREQSPLDGAEETAKRLIGLFPNSTEAKEAEQILARIAQQKSLHEFEVADFYISDGNLPAAAKRVRTLHSRYRDTQGFDKLLETLSKLTAEDRARLEALAGNNRQEDF